MDEAQLDKVGRKPLAQEIQKLVELYHVNDSDLIKKTHTSNGGASGRLPDADKRALSIIIGQSIGRGLDSFFQFSVDTDIKNPTRNNLQIYESGLGLPRASYYQRPNVTQAYEKAIGELFTLVQDTHEVKPTDKVHKPEVPVNWAQVAKNVITFEIALGNIASEAEDEADPAKAYNPYDTAALNKRTPSLDWNLILKNAFPKDVKPPKTVLIGAPEYLDKLNALLEKTSPKTLQNYFAWTLIRSHANNLGKLYRKPLNDVRASYSTTPAVTDRSKVCVDLVSDNVADLVGHYFLEASYTDKSKAKINEIIDSLRATYVKSFKVYDWLDDYTRKGALEKIKAIVQKVGYSTSGPNDGSTPSVDKYYRPLTIHAKDHFGNQVRTSEFQAQNQFRSLDKPVDRKHMFMSPQTVNAYYSPQTNDINIPAGISLPPFFHLDNPEYLNFGALGGVSGHELTHAFDNNGRNFDATGALRNWWSDASVANFDNRTKCFVEQYSNFTLTGADGSIHHVDGELTLGENIADNGGVKKSYESWWARYKSDPTGKRYNNQKLPGFEKFTPEQLFFIQWGRLWCSKTRPEAIQKDLSNSHSPTKFRINGVVQNSEYFAKAFQCPSGTPMNPIKKCDLW
ncbi:Peptidase M13 [Mortierella claussenii]|nr:Peptidase M13 [Mortierella claussenii]